MRAAAASVPLFGEVPVEPRMGMDEVEGVVLRAHQAAGDMSRASLFTQQPLSGALGRCAASFEDALAREGL